GLLTLRSISQDRNQAAAVEGGASAITNEAAQTEEVPAAATEGLPDEGEPEQPQPTAVDRSNFGWETFGNKNDIRSAVPAGDLILTATGGGIVIWEPANDAFEVWDFNTGLPFSRVNSVMPQADGTVWIGTEFGLLRRNPDDSLAHYTPEDGLDSDFVGPVAIGSAGTVMVGTRYGERGLNVFSDGHWSAVDWPGVAEPDPSDLSVVSTQINGIYGDADGTLVITTDQGLAARDNGGWTILKAANGLPADNVIAFAADENGNVWIGTEFGAAHVDISTETLEPVPELEDGPVTAIFQDHNGTMWFGLTGRVASFNLENSDWEYFDEGDGLIGWEIRAIFEDEAGHLWIAGDDGLMQFTEGRFLEFRVPDQPAYSEFSYIVPDQDGDLLTGPFYWGGYAQYGREGGEFEFYELPGDATPMAVTDDGTIWAGSSYAGLWHIGFDNTERQYTTADGLPSDLITSVAVDEQGNVWAGTDAGLARLSPQDDHIEVFDVASGRLLHNYVQTVFVDSADRIWVGTDGGGAVFDGDEWFLLRPGDELHPDALAVYDFAEGPDGIIRIGTDGGGLAEYNPENDAWTQQRDNLPGESPIVVAVDPTDNTVWLAFPWEGVVAHQSGDDWEPLHDLRLADPRVNEIYIADSGEIFFATESGLTRWGP
ncbi:MAG: two-component regulator propeller domain-containing protein, partial [Anaerolineales bacterium]